jgi:hypothetical protein
LLPAFPVTIHSATPHRWRSQKTQRKEVFAVADTKKIADKAERKKLKRASRKKAAPKAKRTTPRGSQKKKVKKMVRGQSKR